jgi:UPF0716 family protein affecting phage T7 exclusion
MKKISWFFLALMISYTLTSCATVFGGKVSQCQRTKPAAGEPARKIRAGAMIADILLFWPGLIVDFATAAIYKPCGATTSSSPATTTNK